MTTTNTNLSTWPTQTLINAAGIRTGGGALSLGLVAQCDVNLFELHLDSALRMLAREGRATTEDLYHHAYSESEAHGEGTRLYILWDAVLYLCHREMERAFGRAA